MVTGHIVWFALLLMFLIAERLFELRSANKNFHLLISMGGKEFGAGHYRTIVIMHTAFFLSLVIEFIVRDASVSPFWPLPLGIFILAQMLRLWSRQTMGERWTTRIVAVPNERLISNGPFRLFKHPIYVAVAMELFSIPLIFGLYFTCVIFTVLDALILLLIRIPSEQRALEWGQKLYASGNGGELP